MAAPLTSMLKMTVPSERSILKQLGVGNGKVNRFGVGKNGMEHANKSSKLSKSGKSKRKKTSKFQNLAKSSKKLTKNRNSTNFKAMEDGPKFLIPDTRTSFNRL